MRANPFLVTIALLSLLTTSLVAPVSSQPLDLPPSYTDSVKAAEGALYDPWERALEKVPFYFDHDNPFPVVAEGPEGEEVRAVPAGFNDGFLHYEPPGANTEFGVDPTSAPIDPSVDPTDKRVEIHDTLFGDDIEGEGGPNTNAFAEFLLPIGGAVAPGIEDLRPSRDWRMYGIEADLYTSCPGQEILVNDIGASTSMVVEILEMVPAGSGYEEKSFYSGVASFHAEELNLPQDTFSGPFQVFRLTMDSRNDALGNFFTQSPHDGRVFSPDDWFKVRISPDLPAANGCILHYGSYNYPSNVRLITDTATLSTWVEDRGGDYTEGLPSADGASQDQRIMTTKIAQATAWPNHNQFQYQSAVPENYQDRIWLEKQHDGYDSEFGLIFGTTTDINSDESRYFYRWMRESDNTIVFDSRLGHNDQRNTLIKPFGDRSVGVLEGGLNLITQDFLYASTLEDGGYHVEVYNLQGVYQHTQTVTVGLKGFTMKLLDSDPLADNVHQVLPGEPTEFRLRFENLGAQADTLKLTASRPGTGWTATLSEPSVTLPAATKQPGQNAVEVTYTVTPGSTISAGTSSTVTITAQSKFAPEVTNQVLALKTQVVDTKANGVALIADEVNVEVSPGQSSTLADFFLAHNKGASADAFIVEAKLPSNRPGWSVGITPPGRLIHADSIENFDLALNVPADAVRGSSIKLPVTITRVSDTTISDTVELTLSVLVSHGLEFSVPQSLLHLRDPEIDCAWFETGFIDSAPAPTPSQVTDELCTYNDPDSDISSLYRLSIHNPSPVADTFTIKGDWEIGVVPGATRGASGTNNSGCDGSHNNDFWRFDYGKTRETILNDVATESRSRDPTELEKISIPPGATVYRWAEFGIVPPTPINPLTLTVSCGAFGDYSPSGFYRVVATADSEPTLKQTINLFTERHDFDAAPYHGVEIEPALDLATSTTTTLRESELSTADQAYSEVRHRFYIRNEASERDDLTIQLSGDTSGVSARLEFAADDTPMPGSACTRGPAPVVNFICKRMGIMEEIYFDVVVQPDAESPQIELGDLLTHSVSVSNRDTGSSDSVSFKTRLVGEARYEADEVVQARNAYPGQDVALGFQVKNLGTKEDSYSISLLSGDPEWTPRLSTDDLVFIPGQHNLDAFLRVKVPETASAGDSKSFQVVVDSLDAKLGKTTLSFAVNVVADPGMKVQGENGINTLLLSRSSAAQDVAVEAIASTGAVGDPITFRVDRAKLPGGWAVQTPILTSALATDSQGLVAPATFKITAPQNALGTSSIALIVEACAGTQQECGATDFLASGDITLNLQDDVGVFLQLDDPNTVTATLPGGEVVFPVRVQNNGLSADTIELTHTTLRTGWEISVSPTFVHLGPLESRVVDVVVKAPDPAEAGESSPFILFGTSALDSSSFDQLPLVASIGVFDLEWSAKKTTLSAGPDETVRFSASILNNGTLPETIVGSAELATEAAKLAYGNLVDVRVTPKSMELAPGQSKDLVVTAKLAPSIGAKLIVPVTAIYESLQNSPETVEPRFDIKVLDYRAKDVDGDGIVEYALDRNENAGDGFEAFSEPQGTAGRDTEPAQLIRFLNDEGRQRHTVKVTQNGTTVDVLILRIDGDASSTGFGDGRRDMFLDDTGDGLPNIYWDPDDAHFSRLTVFKDIDADGVPDYFVDTTGNDEFNAVYNLAQGTFVALLSRDVDNDGKMDFVVDKNGNGRADSDETVLFSRDGSLIQVTKVDVDGDGKLDDVFDTDGDGVPDYYVPAGKTKGVAIKVERDLNGDGFLDWSYDANRDGKDDHFYDPAAQTGGHSIDTAAEFVRSIKEYWYVGALFILVAALFVVLVAVTRR